MDTKTRTSFPGTTRPLGRSLRLRTSGVSALRGMPCPRQRMVSSSSSSVSRGSATHSHTSVAVLNFFRSFRLLKPSSRDLYASWSETSFALASFSSRAYSSSVTRFIPAKFGIGYRDSFTAAYSRLLGPRVWSADWDEASELPGSGLGNPGLGRAGFGVVVVRVRVVVRRVALPFLPLDGFFRPSRGRPSTRPRRRPPPRPASSPRLRPLALHPRFPPPRAACASASRVSRASPPCPRAR